MEYWLIFDNFKKETIISVKTLRKGWRNASTSERIEKSKQWLNEISEIYDIPVVTYIETSDAGTGYYKPITNSIHMAYPSIITLMHEFRHTMQHKIGVLQPYNNKEEDAKAWSLSLYHQVAPNTLQKLIKEGRVFL